MNTSRFSPLYFAILIAGAVFIGLVMPNTAASVAGGFIWGLLLFTIWPDRS